MTTSIAVNIMLVKGPLVVQVIVKNITDNREVLMLLMIVGMRMSVRLLWVRILIVRVRIQVKLVARLWGNMMVAM